MLPRPSLITVLTAATLAIAGCTATAKISLDPRVRQHLDMRGVRAVHYNTPAVVVAARGEGLVARLNDRSVPIEAPVKAVKNRFLAVVSQQLVLTKLEIIDGPRSARISPLMAPPIDLLKHEFDRGLIFDFYAPLWELAPVYQPLWSTAPKRFAMQLIVRARLIDLDHWRILWQQACLKASGKRVQTLAEWSANNNAVFYANMDEEARSCADELVAQFLGET